MKVQTKLKLKVGYNPIGKSQGELNKLSGINVLYWTSFKEHHERQQSEKRKGTEKTELKNNTKQDVTMQGVHWQL